METRSGGQAGRLPPRWSAHCEALDSSSWLPRQTAPPLAQGQCRPFPWISADIPIWDHTEFCQQDPAGPILLPACQDWLPVLTPQPAPQPACWPCSSESASLRKGPSLNGEKHLQILAHLSLCFCEMGQWPLSLGKGQPTQDMTDLMPCYRILASLIFTLGTTTSDW